MKSIRQIRIDGQTVGVVGLDEALQELADSLKGQPREAVEEVLLERLAKDNYIPSGARNAYGKALYREWQRFVGEAVQDEPEQAPSILVVGPGCAQCDALEKTVMEILSEEKLAVNVDHVRDPVAIGEMGILGVPALVVKGRVVFSGRVPLRAELKKLLLQALKDVQ
ncbi:thioredoxin family protein [Desulfosoma caldarium]|uniref:Small redox-active disulfide protein 2 n=1 Tax=Desulfosoma caldarium TaxID=610254 RepID=A0A3N1URK0_9BACT|nr:thioredoxin family protein [Desulfosoma caldarium]ROQ92348.1 small redox-active disulfide protein 2 [Desulfosoma caldarium]